MPFQSQAQAGWAFATGQPFAKRWARQTGPYKKLPKRVRQKTCMDCVLASLKDGELLAPGIRHIRGNLCNVHGRYGLCPGATPSKGKKGGKGRAPKARKPIKPKATPEQRAQAHAAEQTTNRAQVLAKLGIAPDGQQALEALRSGQQADAAAIERGGFVKAGLVEQAADGSYRLTPSGRAALAAASSGDAGRAGDIISSARDRTSARTAREDAAAQRKRDAEAKRAAAAAKKPKAGGGGSKGSSASDATAAREAARNQREQERQADRTRRQQEHEQDRAQRQREHAEDRARSQREHEQDRQQREADRQSRQRPAPTRTRPTRIPIVQRGTANRGTRRKAFAVFKDARGQLRWLSRTTTAFEDRDSEVISTKALEGSAASDAPRGPLRFWHMGRPNPLDVDAPWGPGVDLGWCDFAALSGRTLIESGTFKSEAIGRAVAAKADQLELSPGFFHAAGEPDASGVFNHIRIFERSLVPKWAGRASNPYTGLVVEKAMDQKKIEALQTLGVPEATIKELLADVATTEKAAEAGGVRYKDEKAGGIAALFRQFLAPEPIVTKADEPAPVAEPESTPDPIAELMATVKALQEEVAALKAGPPMLDAEDNPAMGGDSGVDEAAEGEPPLDETTMDDGGDGGLTLSSDDLSAIGQVIGQVLTAALEPLVGALGIVQKLEGGLGELKTAMGGYAKTKDDERAQLVARLDQTEAKLDELTSDAPRNAGYRASQANDNTATMLLEALKENPGGANVGSDHPFADQTAQWFPNLAAPR